MQHIATFDAWKDERDASEAIATFFSVSRAML